jgi:hypothetical protein
LNIIIFIIMKFSHHFREHKKLIKILFLSFYFLPFFNSTPVIMILTLFTLASFFSIFFFFLSFFLKKEFF